MRPRVILVTGAPGSGKSTLAVRLAGLLRVPFIARDDIRGGLLFSAGAWGPELDRVPSADEAVDIFLGIVETLLARGVSCVAEYVVRTHRPADLERILAAGDCVAIMTSCDDALDRVARRNRSDRLVANPGFLTALGYESVEQHTDSVVARMRLVEDEMRREFPVPMLRVDTTGEYQPNLEEIVAFATAVRST